MVHKMDLKGVDIRAVLILGTPTEDIKTEIPSDVPQKEVRDDFYSDLDESMNEFTDSLGGKGKEKDPLIGEKSP